MAETALAVEVPAAEPVLDRLRREHPAAGVEAMPAHITLLYPFADTAGQLDEQVERARAVLARFAAFEIELRHAARFRSEAATVLWLVPEPAEPLLSICQALVDAFPEHPPFGGRFDSIVPHLTVAASPDPLLLDRVEQRLVGELPLFARIEAASLFEHDAAGWRLRTRLAFGA